MALRAYYQNSISEFLNDDCDRIVGELAASHPFDLDTNQQFAWRSQIAHLQNDLHQIEKGNIFFEFSIPRMGKRADVVVLYKGLIYVVEYKVNATGYDTSAKDQALDYALDLKYFHEGSHDELLVPILVATEAPTNSTEVGWYEDGVAEIILTNGREFAKHLDAVAESKPVRESLNSNTWSSAGYRPTPTIIQAAQAMYEGHSVDAISRSHAGAENLSVTSSAVSQIIEQSRERREKSIVFVTGVPGAGKTLCGLNVSIQHLNTETEEHAVFLSGNGPLVRVLTEALARDQQRQAADRGEKLKLSDARRKVSTFIQGIHHFRDEYLSRTTAPLEHVVIFDEAQRAWDEKQTAKFMKTKRGQSSFSQSEPDFLISVMDRKEDWATIVCLIGHGQEINTGEAGIQGWLEAIRESFTHWKMYVSHNFVDMSVSKDNPVRALVGELNGEVVGPLHLHTSIRSFRAENLSNFVTCVLEGRQAEAKQFAEELRGDYPLVITRSLADAREWIREKSRGSERFGLLASSGARRLRPEGIDVKNTLDPAVWFLNDRDDVRSSYYLEDVATEFEVQGLELDWTIVGWDADLRWANSKWVAHRFRGSRWENVKQRSDIDFRINAYRVLLTRARQGIVLFVPTGADDDPTRSGHFYDPIYDYLRSCGFHGIGSS